MLVFWQVGYAFDCYSGDYQITRMFETDDWRTGLICADDERRLLNQTDTFLGWEAISPNPDALKYIIVDTEPGSTNVNILSKS